MSCNVGVIIPSKTANPRLIERPMNQGATQNASLDGAVDEGAFCVSLSMSILRAWHVQHDLSWPVDLVPNSSCIRGP